MSHILYSLDLKDIPEIFMKYNKNIKDNINNENNSKSKSNNHNNFDLLFFILVLFIFYDNNLNL